MAIAALLLFAALSVVLPVVLALDLPSFELGAPSGILYALVVYASARLAWLAYKGERRLLTASFWLFTYVWGLLTAFLQVSARIFPWGRQQTDDDLFMTAILTLVSLLSFELGSVLARRREQRRPATDAWLFSIRWTFVIGLVAIVLAVATIVALGGPSVVMQPRGSAVQAIWREGGTTLGRNIVEVVLRMGPFVTCFAIIFTLQNRLNELTPRGRLLMASLFAIVLPITLISNYPDALSRAWLGTVALAFGFLLVPWRRWTMACIIAALVGAFLFVFPYADRNRGASAEQRLSTAAKRYWSPVVPLVTKGDYDVFVQFANAQRYTREVDYMYGRNFLGSLLFWYPRRMWPEKPTSSSVVIGLQLGFSVVNVSTPLWAEAYLAFGTVGILLIIGGYGFLIGVLDYRYVRQVQLGVNWGLLRLLVPFWAGYQIFFMRGPLMVTVAYSSFAVLLFLLIARWRPYRLPVSGMPRRSAHPHRPAT